MKNATKNTFNRWGMLMQIILVNLKLYFTEKNAKQEKNSFPGKTPLKFKRIPPKKIKQFQSRTCCKHSRSLSYNYWPVIAFYNNMQTEWQLCSS